MNANINDRNVNSDRNIAFQPCAAWEPLLVLFAAGEELDPAEQANVSAHLTQCSICSAALDRERELVSLLAAKHAQPDAALLASCRAGLQDALDRGEERGWLHRSLASFLPSSLLSPRPAWSAAVLLLIGFSVGVLGPRYLRHPQPLALAPNSDNAALNATSGVTPTDDSSASSSGASSVAISDRKSVV